LVVTVREADIETAPVPMLRSLEPAKVKSAFHAWVLFPNSVTGEPLVLLRTTGPIPLMVSGPVPMAVLVFRLVVPSFRVVPPL
jgi:hypothetical protein